MTTESKRELIEFALAEGHENAKTHIESIGILRRETTSTLSFLIAGGGASLGYAIKLLEDGGNASVMIGLFTVSLYLFAICGLLLRKCLWAENVMPAHCEPMNIYLPDYDVLAIKEAELKQLQERCDFNRLITWQIGWWLNVGRVLIFMTPLIFAAAWGLALRVVVSVAVVSCASLAAAALLVGRAMVQT